MGYPLDWLSKYGSAMNRLYTDPGTSPGELEGIAPAVAALGEIRPPGPCIEITADFCQCPACREGRCETVQPERTGCYWPIEDAPA